MLHLPNPDLMKAMGRYHPNGRAKDPHAHHADALAAALRAEARARRARVLQRLLGFLTGRSSRPNGLSSRSTAAVREESRQA